MNEVWPSLSPSLGHNFPGQLEWRSCARSFFSRDPQDRTYSLDLAYSYIILSNLLLLKPFVDDSAFSCFQFHFGHCLILPRIYFGGGEYIENWFISQYPPRFSILAPPLFSPDPWYFFVLNIAWSTCARCVYRPVRAQPPSWLYHRDVLITGLFS